MKDRWISTKNNFCFNFYKLKTNLFFLTNLGLNILLNITATIVFSHDLASYWKSRKLCRIFFHLIRNVYSLGLNGEWYFYLTKKQLLLFISSKFKMSIHILKIFWKPISEIDFKTLTPLNAKLMHGARIYVAKFKIDFFKVNQSNYLKENKITLICLLLKFSEEKCWIWLCLEREFVILSTLASGDWGLFFRVLLTLLFILYVPQWLSFGLIHMTSVSHFPVLSN